MGADDPALVGSLGQRVLGDPRQTTYGSGTPFLTVTYGRDNNSLLTSDSGTSYGYDALNRVASTASTSYYQYDNADQLAQTAVTGGNTTAQTYDIAGQLKASTVTNGQTQVSRLTYSFDANGNRTRMVDQNNSNITLTFDATNRLANYNRNSIYSYSGDGLRMAKTTGGASTNYTWDTAEGLPTIVVDGALAYVTGVGGLPLEQISGSTIYWAHEDQLGSVGALTDALGNVQQTYAFDAYGNLSSSTGSLTNPFRFAGQYFDTETGLYYLRARYFDPTSGQFLSRDPLAETTRRLYQYAAESPLNGSDPSGLLNWGAGLKALGKGLATIVAGPSLDDYAATERSLPGFMQAGDMELFQGLAWLSHGAQGPDPWGLSSLDLSNPSDAFALAMMTSAGGARPENLSPAGAARRGAFRAAKRSQGIPHCQQPTEVRPGRDPGSRDYVFQRDGQEVVIRHDAGGHQYTDQNPGQSRGPHFNTPDGGHYDY